MGILIKLFYIAATLCSVAAILSICMAIFSMSTDKGRDVDLLEETKKMYGTDDVVYVMKDVNGSEVIRVGNILYNVYTVNDREKVAYTYEYRGLVDGTISGKDKIRYISTEDYTKKGKEESE